MKKDDPQARLRKAFGQTLEELMDSAGISQSELARRTAVQQSEISRVTKGESMGRVPAWMAMCKALGVSFRDVVEAAEQKLKAKPGLSVAIVDEDARALLKLFDGLTAEGKRVLLERAKACKTLYPK